MDPTLRYTPMTESDLDELDETLLDPAVYEHIGGTPRAADFRRGLQLAMHGPPPARTGEHWLNYVVRHADSGQVLGRLEATLHDGLAEIAFLYGRQFWGRGYASQGLTWLHGELHHYPAVRSCWGAVAPDNARSANLLLRCGYAEVPTDDLPPLYSYDDGDRVFTRPCAE